MDIDGVRLLADLRHLATFGKLGTGVDRPAFGAADLAARAWLRGRMEQAGLDAAIDNVGNVHGRSRAGGKSILIGSHSDSVPRGGWLDGALGVIYGLEIARAAGGAHVDVISFQEEEGAFLPFLGSRSFCGGMTEAEIDGATNTDGQTLRDAIAGSGLAGQAPARLDLTRHAAFLEAHIEQGPRLEASGAAIGIVTALVGVRRYRIALTGQADHAGTTPMDMRRDSGAALIRLAQRILDLLEAEKKSGTVWNIGNASFAPGAFNVVPAAAEFVVEIRDIETGRLDELERRILGLAEAADGEGGVSVAAHSAGGIEPAAMDRDLQAAITAAALHIGVAAEAMQSGAGHDAMVLSKHIPAAMLFIPSIGGRSHDIAENSSDQDIVTGCRVLAEAVAALL